MPYANKEKYRETQRVYQARYRQENPEKFRLAALKSRIRAKMFAIDQLGGECVVCEETDLRLLTINHINGDGYVDREKFKNQMGGTNPDGIAMYRAIKAGRHSGEGLDVRCYNHNILYEYELGRRGWIEGLV